MESSDKETFYITLDLGTTSTRAHVIDKNFEIVSGARFESQLIQEPDGASELDPKVYFDNIVQILREALKLSGVDAKKIANLGISSQRATFITWDKNTGDAFHNLITWKDSRAEDIAAKANRSLLLKYVNASSKLMYALTRQEFFKVSSNLKIGSSWLNQRLKYFLKNNEALKAAVKENRAVYGALDTWLLCKLKRNFKDNHISDITSCSATGIYDPFKLNFSVPLCKYFGIKRSILPKVVPNCYDFGSTHTDLFGVPIPIAVMVTDQSASMIANCCFSMWNVKITLGTGSFLQTNIGNKIRGSDNGAATLIAWSLKNPIRQHSTVFKLEFFHLHSSESIKFLQTSGLCADVSQSSEIAYLAETSDGVIFLPKTFGFVGIKQSTKNNHLVRAVLESIILNVSHFYFLLRDERGFVPSKIRIDGGIARNDFICQQIANLTNMNLERAKDCSELTSIGCAMLQALQYGELNSLDDAAKYYKCERVFYPQETCRMMLFEHYRKFLRVMEKYDKF